jgi:hypothetical protein
MNSTTPQPTYDPPGAATPHTVAASRSGSASAGRPTWGDTLIETAPIVGAPAFFGPPVTFVLGPWLLLVLLLIGPFALLVTFLLVLALAVSLLAAFVAVIASPFLLVRHLHARGMIHDPRRASLHLSPDVEVSSGQLGSPQPKGAS